MKFNYLFALIIVLIYISPTRGYWSIVSSPLNWILRNIPRFSNSGFTEATRLLANITNHDPMERRSSTSNNAIYIVSGPYDVVKNGVKLSGNSSNSLVFNIDHNVSSTESVDYTLAENHTSLPVLSSNESTLSVTSEQSEMLPLVTNSFVFTTERVLWSGEDKDYEKHSTDLPEAEAIDGKNPHPEPEINDVSTATETIKLEEPVTKFNDADTAKVTEISSDGELLVGNATESLNTTVSNAFKVIAINDKLPVEQRIFDEVVMTNNVSNAVKDETFGDDNDKDPWLGYFDVVRSNDLKNCLSLMVCETAAEPELYQEYGHRVSNFFRMYTPKENNRAAWWYKNAALLGHEYKSIRVCRDNFPFCDIDTRHIVMFMEVPI